MKVLNTIVVSVVVFCIIMICSIFLEPDHNELIADGRYAVGVYIVSWLIARMLMAPPRSREPT